MLGLDTLSRDLNATVSKNTDTNGLASGLNSTLTDWAKTSVLPLVSGALIVVTVGFVFWGSFQYFTAYGDENKAAQAKKTIAYAFVGLIIASLAFAIASYSQRILIDSRVENNPNPTVPTTSGPQDKSSNSDIPSAIENGANNATIFNSNP